MYLISFHLKINILSKNDNIREPSAVSRRQTYNYPHLAKGDYFVRGHTEGSPQDGKKTRNSEARLQFAKRNLKSQSNSAAGFFGPGMLRLSSNTMTQEKNASL